MDAVTVLSKRWQDIPSRLRSSCSQPGSKTGSKIQWDGECHRGMFVVGHSLLDDYKRPYLPSTVGLRVVGAVLAVKATPFLRISKAPDCPSLNGGSSVVHPFFRNASSGAAVLAKLGTKRR